MVSGFPINTQRLKEDVTQFQPWIHTGGAGTYSFVSDDGSGNAVFKISITVGSLIVGDPIFIQSNTGGTYIETGFVTEINVDEFTTTIPFNGDGTGTYQKPLNVTWDTDTPKKLLREIHLEVVTPIALLLQITLDGINWLDINNNETLEGLNTFSLFVNFDSQFNIRFSSNVSSQNVTVIVAAA